MRRRADEQHVGEMQHVGEIVTDPDYDGDDG